MKKVRFFAVEIDKGLESIIGNIYQSFSRIRYLQECRRKRSNYIFLNFYGILYKNGNQVIDNNTLIALTLLIAESNPKEKDVIIDLVMNFLNKEYSSLKLKLKSWSILPISGMKKIMQGAANVLCNLLF